MLAQTDHTALFRDCRRLIKDGRAGEASQRLAEALRHDALDAADLLHAGRLLTKIHRDTAPADLLRVRMLGQCTTSWLATGLTAVARGRGQALVVDEADYDNVLQGLDALDEQVDAVVLLPWHQRLLGASERSNEARLQDELDFWRQAWAIAGRRKDLRVVQVGYDWLDAGAEGLFNGGLGGNAPNLVRQANQLLCEHLPTGAYFVDLEQASGMLGRDRMYDRRSYHWAKQPFSNDGIVTLSRHLWAGLRATITGPKKVLVLDLDNTLWGGVVGEAGPLGIELGDSPAGDAHREFQRLARSLAGRGVLIAVCSKNNPDDAREPFDVNPDMVLRMEDIVAFEASWRPKAEVISEMAATLRLGLDSFVFFDDEPAERALVRAALPDVEVVDVPEDPADYRKALLDGLWFETVGVSNEDRMRTTQYRVERAREDSRLATGSMTDYLRSLEMTGDIDEVDETNIGRVGQLIGKTNQFNLTTRRHSIDTVNEILGDPDAIVMALRMQDRFGDYGLVGVIIALSDDGFGSNTLRLDTWLMSCRVIGRTAEQFMFNALLEAARALGCEQLVGEYIATQKNDVVADLYERLGFTSLDGDSSGPRRFGLSVADATPAETLVSGPGA